MCVLEYDCLDASQDYNDNDCVLEFLLIVDLPILICFFVNKHYIFDDSSFKTSPVQVIRYAHFQYLLILHHIADLN